MSMTCFAVSAPFPECGQIPGLFVHPEIVPSGASPCHRGGGSARLTEWQTGVHSNGRAGCALSTRATREHGLSKADATRSSGAVAVSHAHLLEALVGQQQVVPRAVLSC
jgi:hypothetical protein